MRQELPVMLQIISRVLYLLHGPKFKLKAMQVNFRVKFPVVHAWVRLEELQQIDLILNVVQDLFNFKINKSSQYNRIRLRIINLLLLDPNLVLVVVHLPVCRVCLIYNIQIQILINLYHLTQINRISQFVYHSNIDGYGNKVWRLHGLVMVGLISGQFRILKILYRH